MRGSVTVHEAAAFDTWVAEEGGEPAVETAPADSAAAELEAASAPAVAPQDHAHPSDKPDSEGEERA
jgi:heme/copper-type cytochrome/quinol oxidase subunit 2